MEMKNVKEIMIPEGLNKEATVASTSASFYSSTAQSSYTYLNSYSTSDSNLGQSDLLKINFTVISHQGNPYIESMITYVNENGTTQYPEFTINGTTNFNLTVKLSREVDSNTWEVLLLEQYDQNGNINYIRVQLAKTSSGDLGIYVKNDVAIKMFTLQINSIKTINNFGVSKITTANGDIIWGSPDAFPYRLLDYIYFSGNNEYINTGLQGSSGHYWQVLVSFDTYTETSDVLCSYNDTIANTRKRFYLGRGTTGPAMRFNLGNTWSNTISVPLNNKMKLEGRTAQSGSNTILYIHVENESGSTLIDTSITSATNTTNSNGYNLFLMANNNDNKSAERFSNGKVYNLIQKATNSSGIVEFNGIPCQRKSDNVCGLYDVINNTFYPMQGTNITTTAAGTILDEYWDLTAPE